MFMMSRDTDLVSYGLRYGLSHLCLDEARQNSIAADTVSGDNEERMSVYITMHYNDKPL